MEKHIATLVNNAEQNVVHFKALALIARKSANDIADVDIKAAMKKSGASFAEAKKNIVAQMEMQGDLYDEKVASEERYIKTLLSMKK